MRNTLMIGGTVLLAACQAPSQSALNATTAACSQGYRDACRDLPALNAQVQQENVNNQLATGAAAVLGGAVIGGALAAPYGNRGYYGRPYGYGYNRGYYRGW